ncbi:helix-turn-helix transcriptional regulator [Actinocrispum sp. NPDC049592]|uniref:helix-turn-helix domain-containing protein n=1 Tax=Actinocrispum sp. NPDC049592 TaxID=3154835 RepID=UPI00343D2861
MPGPLMPRKQLANALKELREASGATLEDVATALLISTSKLSRLENAQGKPQPRDVRDLIRHYRIENTDQARQLTRWARAAGERAWWEDYDLSSGLSDYLATEAEASIARVYTIPVLPVLLQTREYTRALLKRMEPLRSPSELEQLLEVREKRKAALKSREDQDLAPLRLIAVTHESSVRQLVGSAEIMRGQLDYLIEQSGMSNVELRVLPFSATPPFTSTGMYAYFEFDDYDRDIVSVETHAGFFYIEEKDRVGRYRRYYDELVRTALDPDESRQLIHAVKEEFFTN